MRFPSFTKLEWFVIAVILALVALIAAPAPHWRETSRQSCHLCGNRIIVIRTYRWWGLQNDTTEPMVGAEYPIPTDHIQEWWQYGSSFTSWSQKWAADKSSRYKDGRFNWTPK